MAGEKSLKAEVRKSDFGSAGSRRVLRSGNIPAVVYGKEKPLHVTVNAREFAATKGQFTSTTIISLDVKGDKERRVFLKALQEDTLKGIVKHIDFYEVTIGQALRAKVKLELTGNPIGVRNGGVLEQTLHEVEVECLPRNLPESISVDVSALEIDDVLRLGSIEPPKDVKILGDGEATIASVRFVKEKKEEVVETEEAAAEEATVEEK